MGSRPCRRGVLAPRAVVGIRVVRLASARQDGFCQAEEFLFKELVRALFCQPLVARVECRVVWPFGSRSGEPEAATASATTHSVALIAQ
jgi:hypothetical protein